MRACKLTERGIVSRTHNERKKSIEEIKTGLRVLKTLYRPRGSHW